MKNTRSTSSELPERIETVEQLEELLSRPTAEVVELFKRLQGPLAIVGGGGKIGPSLTAMACRARQEAGGGQEILVIDRFPDAAVRQRLEKMGAKTVVCDLLDPEAVKKLPDAANVVYMVGMKFGTTGQPSLTWAINGLVSDYAAKRYRGSRIVAFSTGCVYNLVPADGGGSVESDPLDPPGEYANSCVARERVLEFNALATKTPLLLLRLNYAVEMRYGVLVDVAQAIAAGQPVDVTMGYANVIWQGDVNAATLRLLEHATCPPTPLNLTGTRRLSIREVAEQLGRLMGRKVTISGKETPTALLSNCAKAVGLLGEPRVPTEAILRWTADWVSRGGASLGKPTHFQTRDGKY